MTFTPIEQEAIILSAVIEMIDEMVNHSIWCIPGERAAPSTPTNLLPQNLKAKREFVILLRDFLSPVTSRGHTPLPFDLPAPKNGSSKTDHTTLFYLKRICSNPLLSEDIGRLSDEVITFADWLEASATLERVWLSNINLEVDLQVKRIDFIRMAGDLGKHNFLRLGGQAHLLKKIMADNGTTIDLTQAYLALPDAWTWFFEHLIGYHGSTIAEFLNNIRLAIRGYIRPLAEANYQVISTTDGFPDVFNFTSPQGLQNDFAYARYFGLLQDSLRAAPFPYFCVTQSLKDQF